VSSRTPWPSEPGSGTGAFERGEPEVVVLDDATALAGEAADRIGAGLRAAVAAHAAAHFALTGGSSPIATYRVLAGRMDIPWPAVHLWWVDDRFVPPDHPESNVAVVHDTLLRADSETVHGAAIPAANVHPFPIVAGLHAGSDAERVADAYAEEILRHVPSREGRPAFDVMLLGVGPDGHVMSVFPGSPALAPDAPLALAVPAPREIEPHLPRVTLRASAADDAGMLLVIIPDGAKAAITSRALGGPRDVSVIPAQVARRAGATWMLTREAAAELRGGP